MFVPNSPLRYNYTYTNNENISFNIFKVNSNIDNQIPILMSVPVSTLGDGGYIVVDIKSPFNVKRLFEYSYDSGVFILLNDDLVNTQFSTDGIHTKDSLNIIISIVDIKLNISIDVTGSDLEIIGRCNLTPK